MNIFEQRKEELKLSYTDIGKELGLTRFAICRIVKTPGRNKTIDPLARVGEILGIPFNEIKEAHEKARIDYKGGKDEKSSN